MKKSLIWTALAFSGIMSSCVNNTEQQLAEPVVVHDTVVVHETSHDTLVVSMPSSLTFNLPTKVECFHADKPEKARLVVLLHGGVKDQGRHTFLGSSHLDYVKNDEIICDYLERKGEKSIFLAPICHKANKTECVAWDDCAADVKRMIDDLVTSGCVDAKQIYLTGGSDGGRGTWCIADRYPDLFAAIMPMSCGSARLLPMPIYWHSTRAEGDFSAMAEELNGKGARISYRYHGDVGHGIDCNRITDELLDQFFSNKKK